MGLMIGTVLEKTITFGQSRKNPSGTYNRKRFGSGGGSGGVTVTVHDGKKNKNKRT